MGILLDDVVEIWQKSQEEILKPYLNPSLPIFFRGSVFGPANTNPHKARNRGPKNLLARYWRKILEGKTWMSNLQFSSSTMTW